MQAFARAFVAAVLFLLPARAAAQAQILFSEDFESGGSAWTAIGKPQVLWHVAEDGECDALTRMATYNRFPSACDYRTGGAGSLPPVPVITDVQPAHGPSSGFTSIARSDWSGHPTLGGNFTTPNLGTYWLSPDSNAPSHTLAIPNITALLGVRLVTRRVASQDPSVTIQILNASIGER